jgi:prophage maintenance system killer protein
MAAAYLFHICANHPYVDGNKRTAAEAADVFLYVNGYAWRCPKRTSRRSFSRPRKANSRRSKSQPACASIRDRASSPALPR